MAPAASKPHVAKRIYDDQELAAIYVTLTTNNGNVLRTARETGMPQQTLRDYKRKWEEHGPPETVRELAVQMSGEFEADAEKIRDMALAEIKRQIQMKEVKASTLVTVVGVLTDKIRLAQGLATSRSETVHRVDPAHIATQIASLVQDALSATVQRDGEIIEAEVVEEPAQALLTAAP